MSILKNAKAKITAIVFVAAFAAMSIFPLSAAAAPKTAKLAATSGDITVYVSVEKSVFNLSRTPLKVPVAVSVPSGSTALDALEDVEGSSHLNVTTGTFGGVTYHYVEGIYDYENTSASKYFASTTPTSNEYRYLSNVSTIDSGLGVTSSWNGTVNTNHWLTAVDYNRNSGWMISVDNSFVSDGVDHALSNGDVVQMEYTLYGGCDLGETGYIENSSGSWIAENPFNTRADKSTLVSAMANYSGSHSSSAYQSALSVFEDLEATSSQVAAAVNGL